MKTNKFKGGRSRISKLPLKNYGAKSQMLRIIKKHTVKTTPVRRK